jgi:RNA polymerase sigma-70 factor (ECF subfamily)
LLAETEQAAIAAGLRQGERSAWTRLYEGYSLDVWRYVARLVGSDAAAVADVVQEVFLAAAGSARQFDAERGSLWAWLTGIAHRQVAAYWRQASRQSRLRSLVEAKALEVQHLLDAAQEVQWLEQRLDCADLVRAVLAELPPDYAALLAAKYLDERSLEDIALETGSSAEAIKSKLARARREFRQKYETLTRAPASALRG